MAGMIVKFHSIPDFITFHKILGKFVSNLLMPMPKDVDPNFHVINHYLEFFHISFINSNH